MTEREAFNNFCWRILELARSRKTGAIQVLCQSVSPQAPGERPSWHKLKPETISSLQNLGGYMEITDGAT